MYKRQVGGRDGLDDVVLALLHVHEACAVVEVLVIALAGHVGDCLLYTSRDKPHDRGQRRRRGRGRWPPDRRRLHQWTPHELSLIHIFN